jgi:5-methylcytosine-specific restriction endonuclease McrA
MSTYMKSYTAANAQRNRERAQAWAKANPERRNATVRARYAATGGESKRRYYTANREALIAAAVKWGQANPERRKKINSAYGKRNPEKVRFHVERRRARKANADTRLITLEDWRRLCVRYDNCCAYCGTSGKLTQDHIIPIVRGGRHAIGNLLPACGACNSSKGSKLLVEWRAFRLAQAA